ncbi:unnamed protein product, partial [Rotaria sp. Silwood1]
MISIRSNSSTGTTTGSTTTTTPIPPAQQKKIDAAFALLIVSATGALLSAVAFVELSERTAQTVWWAYEPIVDANPSFSEPPLSPKHKRFVPYVLIEKFRTGAIGNQKCKNGNGCKERELEHIVIFHSADFRPQPRWSPDYPIYIGFHRTRADFAISIAHSDMNISQTPPQMLGFGIYFARSITNTEGKAREAGAYICAEVRMGK